MLVGLLDFLEPLGGKVHELLVQVEADELVGVVLGYQLPVGFPDLLVALINYTYLHT